MTGLTSPWDQDGPPPPAGTDDRPGAVVLSALVAAGPVIWMVHLAGAAALVPYACAHGSVGTWAINALTVATAAVIAGAGWWSGRIALAHRPGSAHPDAAVFLVALLALSWNAISLLVTIVEGVPNLVIPACPV